VAQLHDFAALDREQKAWAERRRLFEEDPPQIREMVREEFLQDLDWR